MPQTTKSSADRHVRWLETSTKCSKHTVHQLCLTGRSQAENSRHSNKLTAKRQRLLDRAGHHVRHPVYISGLRPRGRQKTTGTKSHTPKEGNTLHSGHSKAQRETPDHHGSHFPGSGTNVGHYKQLIRPNARDPPRTRLNTTTSQFSLPSTGDPCIIHKNKNGPVESECKLNNVNPHIIRNQIQNQIEVTLNKDRCCKLCHYQTNTAF